MKSRNEQIAKIEGRAALFRDFAKDFDADSIPESALACRRIAFSLDQRASELRAKNTRQHLANPPRPMASS